jgi:hypothetical protein
MFYHVKYDDRMTWGRTPLFAQGVIIQEATTVRSPRMACDVYNVGRCPSDIVCRVLKRTFLSVNPAIFLQHVRRYCIH